jgi:polyphosphate kinase
VDLIVRGICILRPGVKGLSDNIRVRSTIGRFLEHSRIFYFRNGGDDMVYLSSADWMDRNFFRRVELAFPILNPRLKKRVIQEGLRMHLSDTDSSWTMLADGSYRLRRTGQGRSVQDQLLQLTASGSQD